MLLYTSERAAILPVEVAGTWRKSSRSMMDGNCVEVADLACALIGVRDSKNHQRQVLHFAPGPWRRFLGEVRDGRFDP